ncbi:hypothetical protein DPMN_116589 [Dreissena polymorpha]|uniref:Uncharacterized protein n=1 Tax=Dreissena polymorpha TaxID=45954 RepID=A0A9D4KNA9_DREPO|nr:hypothetical protein DPMN_116589 [Dreissena polymorpha]
MHRFTLGTAKEYAVIPVTSGTIIHALNYVLKIMNYFNVPTYNGIAANAKASTLAPLLSGAMN